LCFLTDGEPEPHDDHRPPALRVGVHQRGGQPRQRVQQVVLGVDRDPVRLDRAGTGIDDHLAFSAQTVYDPAQSADRS